MSVPRLYAPDLPVEGGQVVLDTGPSRHVRVLRLRTNDEVVLFDGAGRAAHARIETLADRVVCISEAPRTGEPKRARVVLALAIPKGSKLDDCVRMATELGVDEVALMCAKRSVPRWDAERAHSRVERLTRIACEAAAQCERLDVPIIHDPQTCEDWLERFPQTAHGVLFGARAVGQVTLDCTPEHVWCAVGPEGGFTDEEHESFLAAGFAVASLGKWILRVDTAVAAALTIIQDRLHASLQAR